MRRLIIRIAPLAIFLVLALLILWVWWQQVQQQRRSLKRHTDDVCFQASRRIQVLVESLLKAAEVFSNRWATHEARDFSHKRFQEFGSVLTNGLPGYHSIWLIPTGGGTQWKVPRRARSAWSALDNRRRRLLNDSTARGGAVLSAPVVSGEGHTSLFAALPLRREAEILGHLVVEFRSEDLIRSGFNDRIRSEFNLRVEDDGRPLFTFAGDPIGTAVGGTVRASRGFSIRNRTWRMVMAPRQEVAASSGWLASLSLPLIGLLLALSLSWLIHLLFRRVELYRAAHGQAIQEVAERERAQHALRQSEARYHSVFDSSTEGLLVIDHGGHIVEANPAACQMYGYKAGDLPGRSIEDLFTSGSEKILDDFNIQIEEFGTAHVDTVSCRRDGATLDLEVRGTALDYGGAPHVLAILTDVSDLKQAVRRQALLSRKILMAQEDERARVSRDLHDELGQILTALRLELGWLHKKASATSSEISGAFGGAVEMVEKAAGELRRVCKGLRPPLLDDLGLEPAIRLLVEDFEARAMPVMRFAVQLDEDRQPTPPEVALCTYRILQESLNNITRHAGAGTINISLTGADSELVLSVYDDGVGFDMLDRETTRGSGIIGMRERAYLVGGTLEIRSEPHQGTRIVLRVPVHPSIKEGTP